MTTKVKLIAAGVITPSELTLTTASAGTNTVTPATTAFVQQELTSGLAPKATIASPTFTGTPSAPTAAGSTTTTQLATTAFVQQELTTLIGGAPSTLNDLNELAAAINDDANYNSTLTTALATKLPLAGGTLTGTLNAVAANFSSNVRVSGWLTGASATNTLFSGNSTGTIIQTPSNTNDAAGSFYIRDSQGNVHFTLNTNTNVVDIAGTISSGDITVIDPVSNNFNGKILIGGAGSNRRLILEQNDVLTYRMGGTGSNSITQLMSGGSAGVGTVGLTLDASQNATFAGNVGIGTTSPDEKLHVFGQGSFENAGNANRGNLILGAHGSGTAKWSTLGGTHYNDATGSGSGTGAAGCMIIGNYSDASNNRIYIGGGPYELNPATEIRFNTHSSNLHNLGGSLRMLITSAGNVGIGSTSPNFKLVVAHNTRNGMEFVPNASDAGTNILQNYNRGTAAYTPFRLASSTTTMLSGSNAQYSWVFDVDGNIYSPDGGGHFRIASSFGFTADGTGNGAGVSGTNVHFNGATVNPTAISTHGSFGAAGIVYAWGGHMKFFTNEGAVTAGDALTEKMTLKANGDFLIGTTATNAYKLEVYDGDYTTMMVRGPTYPTIRLKADNQNSGNNGSISIGAANALVLQPNNTTSGIAIENNGRLRSSTKQYYLSSTSGRGDHFVHTGGHHGAGTYTLFTMPANVTQSAGMVEIWWIYGTPCAAGYTKYLISGNKSITSLETTGLNGTGAIPTIAWSGQALRVTNSNGSTYYHVRVTLHEIGNAWNPTWGNLSGIA